MPEEYKEKIRKINEKRVNTFIKSFFDCLYEECKLHFDNLDSFYHNIILSLDSIEEFVSKNERNIDYSKVTHCSTSEKIALIKDFFNYIGVQFNIDKILDDGTFDIETIPTDEAIKRELNLSGYFSFGENNHPSIEVYNTDLITDLFIWIHEITHYRNRPDDRRNEVDAILTESLAFTYELITIDYLEERGFSYEAAIYQYEFLRNMNASLFYVYHMIKLLILFDNFGSVNIDDYKELFGYDDDYDKCLEIFLNVKDKSQNAIFDLLWYSVASTLSTYMYIKWQNDHTFIKNIEELNKSINYKSMSECLKEIRIFDLSEETFNKFSDALETYKSEITSGSETIQLKADTINEYFIDLVKLFQNKHDLIFNNIEDIVKAISILLDSLKPFFKETIPNLEVSKLCHSTKDEKLSIISDFYKYIGKDQDLDNTLNHTTFTYSLYNPEDDVEELLGTSMVGYNDDESGINEVHINDTGYLLDSAAWVHEFSHFHNIPNGTRSQSSFILTECVAFAEELIFADYLEKIGYTYESAFIKSENLNNFYIFALDAYHLDKALSVFIKEGELSKENYLSLYPDDDDFEDNIDESIALLTSDTDDFQNGVRYSIACLISIYMYIEYKKDSSFIKDIERFEKHINTLPFYNCLPFIGLTGLDEYSINLVKNALEEFKKEIRKFEFNHIITVYDNATQKVLKK